MYYYFVENQGRDNLVSEHRFRIPRDRGETLSLMSLVVALGHKLCVYVNSLHRSTWHLNCISAATYSVVDLYWRKLEV